MGAARRAQNAGRRFSGLPGDPAQVQLEWAIDPNQMYLAAYEFVFPNYG
jgi:hypothetical protein